MTPVNYLLRDIEGLRHNWGWFLALGVVLIILGMFALGSAVATTVVSMWLFGWFLIVSGIFEIVHAFWARKWGGFFLQLLLGILAVVVGDMVVENPLEVGITLTLVMAVFFVFGGVLRMVSAFAMPFEGRGWLFFSGLIDLLMGILIWRQWPVSGLWVIGLFIGIDLIFHGWWLVMLALSVRSTIPAVIPPSTQAVPPPVG
jgi:uncharacterized membrane protein HdeD (DUF308 family)